MPVNYTVQCSFLLCIIPPTLTAGAVLVAEESEELHRPAISNLEHCPLKANMSCLIFPLHQGKMSSVQPLSGLDPPLTRESRATNEHAVLLTAVPLLFTPLQYSRKSNACTSRLSHPWPLFAVAYHSSAIESAVVRHQSSLS
jgi:hypothetical protein